MKEYQTLHPHFLHGADYNPDQWLAYPEVLAQDPEMNNTNSLVIIVQKLL